MRLAIVASPKTPADRARRGEESGISQRKRSMAIGARWWNGVPRMNNSIGVLGKKIGLKPFGPSPKEDGERLTRPFKCIDGPSGQNVCIVTP